MTSIIVTHPLDPLPPGPQAPRRVLVGPANSAGQAGLWAGALRHHLPGTSAIGFQYGLQTGTATTHLRADPALRDRSPDWNHRFRDYVAKHFTHVLLESNRPLWHEPEGSARPEQMMRTLREAGVSVALVAHGSDVKVPSAYRHLHPDTQYEYLDPDFVHVLEEIARDNVRTFASFEGPAFVTSPVLLRFVPSARWLPLVIDTARWATDRPAFERDVPVVVHSPSSAQKGSVWIDPAMQALHDGGLIEYRRLSDVPHEEMPDAIHDADILIEQLGAGGYGVAACEAMAAGRVVVGTVTPLVRRHIALATGLDVPIVRATRESLAEVIRSLVVDPVGSHSLGEAGRAYTRTLHDGRYAAAVLGTWIHPATADPAPEPRPAPAVAPVVALETTPARACSVILTAGDSTRCLEETLTSLERQTVGLGELQIVVAEHASSGDARRLVDELVSSHPESVVTSLSPSSTTSTADLIQEVANGRYVLFLRVGEILEADALEILVNHADAWESDVVFGQLSSGSEREDPPGPRPRLRDLDLQSSALPDYLSHPRLYRRELLARIAPHRRSPLSPSRDLLFTVAAMVRAQRVSLIGTTVARRCERHRSRPDLSPTDGAERYEEINRATRMISEHLPPGDRRDIMMKAQFDQVIWEDLRDSFASRDSAGQAFTCEQIRRLTDEHLTVTVLHEVSVARRASLLLAAAGQVEAVVGVIESSLDPTVTTVPIEIDGDRAFLGYPGYGTTGVDREAWQIFDEDPYDHVVRAFGPPRVEFDGTQVVLAGDLALRGTPVVKARLVRPKKARGLDRVCDEPPLRRHPVDLEIDPAQGIYRLCVETSHLRRGRYRIRVATRIAGRWYDIDLQRAGQATRRVAAPLSNGRLAKVIADKSGRLVLALRPMPDEPRGRRRWLMRGTWARKSTAEQRERSSSPRPR